MSRGVSFIQMVWMMALCGVLLLATLQHANSMKVPVPQQEGGQVQEDAGEEIQGQKETLTSVRASGPGADSIFDKFKEECSEKRGKGTKVVNEQNIWLCSGSVKEFEMKKLSDCQKFCEKTTDHWKYCRFDRAKDRDYCFCTTDKHKGWEPVKIKVE
eukprot:Nk52_evm8s2650 gene=Nk52_evmTU8s2650